MVDRNEAETIQREFRGIWLPNINNPAPNQWPRDPIEVYYDDGAWWFVYKRSADRPEAIVVPDDRKPHLLLGAMASIYSPKDTGLPRTDELFLGSADNGRYQLFESGIGVWEAPADIAYFIGPTGQQEAQGGRTVPGLIAFFDLRGFTPWSKGRPSREVQGVIEKVESKLQLAFGRRFKGKLFFKSTGDGAMVVSEDQRSQAVLAACCSAVIEIASVLPRELPVGCGIAQGEVMQLFMFGRYDYIGEAVNEAAKLQQLAWNEVCVTPMVYQMLESEGVDLKDTRPMGDRGFRICVKKMSSLLNA